MPKTRHRKAANARQTHLYRVWWQLARFRRLGRAQPSSRVLARNLAISQETASLEDGARKSQPVTSSISTNPDAGSGALQQRRRWSLPRLCRSIRTESVVFGSGGGSLRPSSRLGDSAGCGGACAQPRRGMRGPSLAQRVRSSSPLQRGPVRPVKGSDRSPGMTFTKFANDGWTVAGLHLACLVVRIALLGQARPLTLKLA